MPDTLPISHPTMPEILHNTHPTPHTSHCAHPTPYASFLTLRTPHPLQYPTPYQPHTLQSFHRTYPTPCNALHPAYCTPCNTKHPVYLTPYTSYLTLHIPYTLPQLHPTKLNPYIPYPLQCPTPCLPHTLSHTLHTCWLVARQGGERSWRAQLFRTMWGEVLAWAEVLEVPSAIDTRLECLLGVLYINIYVYICIYILCVCVYVYRYIYTVRVYMYIYIYIQDTLLVVSSDINTRLECTVGVLYIYICIHTYIYLCGYIYIHICIYIYRTPC